MCAYPPPLAYWIGHRFVSSVKKRSCLESWWSLEVLLLPFWEDSKFLFLGRVFVSFFENCLGCFCRRIWLFYVLRLCLKTTFLPEFGKSSGEGTQRQRQKYSMNCEVFYLKELVRDLFFPSSLDSPGCLWQFRVFLVVGAHNFHCVQGCPSLVLIICCVLRFCS